MKNSVLVSILVRTCNRPEVLEKCIESIRQQTYSNIEVIVVEDGEALSKELLEKRFADMSIRYANTGEKKGRVSTGNLALSMATGKYVNFLDDDDLLLPKHVETLVRVLEKQQGRVAYAVGCELRSVYFKSQKRFVTLGRKLRYRIPFNRLYLMFVNYLPIQTVMFARKLYEEYGGFTEQLDYLEDWELWVRYASHTDFIYVPKVTSCYRVPICNRARQKKLDVANAEATKCFAKYQYTDNVEHYNQELREILLEIRKPKWIRMARKILRKR